MKKIVVSLLAISVLTCTLFAHGSIEKEVKKTQEELSTNHMGNHMHNGKMSNHSNPEGMSDEKMKIKKNEMSTNHMGDHMHNGKMSNHSNPEGMTNKEMKEH